jgi:hypothetical protein
MTSLADYCLPGADPDLQEPLAGRLLGLLEHFDGRLMILSGRRSWGEQQRLYELYLAGGNLAARPGTSNHEKGLAADLALFDGLTWRLVHAEAEIRGLRFPIPGESWHAEVDPAWVEPEEWDMTDDDMRKLAGFIAEALDARPRSVHSYRDGGQYEINARILDEYEFAETQQATLAAQGKDPK